LWGQDGPPPPSRHRRRLGERDGGQCPHSGKAAGANAPAGVSRQKWGETARNKHGYKPGYLQNKGTSLWNFASNSGRHDLKLTSRVPQAPYLDLRGREERRGNGNGKGGEGRGKGECRQGRTSRRKRKGQKGRGREITDRPHGDLSAPVPGLRAVYCIER